MRRPVVDRDFTAIAPALPPGAEHDDAVAGARVAGVSATPRPTIPCADSFASV
jgi:hypothetical protein